MTKPTSPILQAGNALAGGLLRCYPIDEGSGSILHDLAPGNRNATARTAGSPAAATWGADGTVGAFVMLNGTNQDATASDAGLPAGASPRTLAFLARAPARSDGDLGFLFGYGTSGDGLFAVGHADPDSDQGLARQALWATTLSHGCGNTADLADNAWHLCVVTIDSMSRIRMYIDAVAVGVGDKTHAISTDPFVFSPLATSLSGTMFLGQIGGTANIGYYFRGDLAGAWAWDRPLSPSDVAAMQTDPWQMVRPADPGSGGGGGRYLFMALKP